jgi:hypothetical protein
MTTAPDQKPGPDAAMADAAGWTVQIGPTLSGNAYGYFYASSANFYVSLGGGTPDTTYVWYLNASNNWQPIPNNQIVQVSASPSGIVAFFYNAPTSSSGYKFLMGPV